MSIKNWIMQKWGKIKMEEQFKKNKNNDNSDYSGLGNAILGNGIENQQKIPMEWRLDFQKKLDEIAEKKKKQIKYRRYIKFQKILYKCKEGKYMEGSNGLMSPKQYLDNLVKEYQLEQKRAKMKEKYIKILSKNDKTLNKLKKRKIKKEIYGYEKKEFGRINNAIFKQSTKNFKGWKTDTYSIYLQGLSKKSSFRKSNG